MYICGAVIGLRALIASGAAASWQLVLKQGSRVGGLGMRDSHACRDPGDSRKPHEKCHFLIWL
jgi:hypothetical protein